MQYVPNLGETPAEDARRDAVHVAVAPVVAGEVLTPGARVALLDNGRAVPATPLLKAVGVVDPFLSACPLPGQRFWIFLFPNTVTSLRHVWTHPAFAAKVPPSPEPPAVPSFEEVLRGETGE